MKKNKQMIRLHLPAGLGYFEVAGDRERKIDPLTSAVLLFNGINPYDLSDEDIECVQDQILGENMTDHEDTQ